MSVKAERASEEIGYLPGTESGVVEKLLANAHEKGAASVVVKRRNDASGNPIGYLLMSDDAAE